MENFNPSEIPKFSSHKEEIDFLRGELSKREAEIKESGIEVNKEHIAHTTIVDYKKNQQDIVLSKNMQIGKQQEQELVLRLRPEKHDHVMEELLAVMLDKGIFSALKIIEELKNPHLDADFHRFLVQYLLETHDIPGLKKTNELWKSIDMRLFEITLPEAENDKEHSDFKSLITAMEQFYSGMHSVSETAKNKEKNYFSLEIVLAENSDHIVFYVAVPTTKASLMEKHILGVHPKAIINEVPDDHNIFAENNPEVSASFGVLKNYEVFPIKTFDTFDYDPLNIIINVFTKLKRSGEGACVQFNILPKNEEYVDKYHSILEEVRDGKKVKDIMRGTISAVTSGIGGAFMDIIKSKSKEDEKKVDNEAVGYIEKKIQKMIMATNLKIVTTGQNKDRANIIRREIESSFNQFTEVGQNGIDFNVVKDKDMGKFLHEYTYRMFDYNNVMPFNLSELATIFHFPYSIENSPQLKQAKASGAPAPIEMGEMEPNEDAVLLGYNTYRGITTPIYMRKEDRMRHFYVIGQTGTGKSGILRTMIAQDIAKGEGVCFIDPHGNDIQDILSYIPKERIDDVIYFDPAYTPRPMALNMLEYDPRFPEQKSMVIDALMSIFNQLFSKETMGPQFEQYFKNAAFLVMDHPESGNTLLEITRVMTDKTFREMKLSHCKNPIVKQFWKSAEETTGESGLQNYVPYITSKFDGFISNEFLRPIILQNSSVLNMREIMDNKKILLVNLSKGRLGELNANLIGMILVMKFQMAALSRADSYGKKLEDFFLYIDEFQNVTTPAISSILSEARKYRLSLNLAHQYISQLEENIKGAVFGNVGSKACFRVSPEDAEFMQKQFDPVFSSNDILKLENRCSYMAMLYKGQPVKPFDIKTADNPAGNAQIVPVLKELSYLRYGRDREEVENEIMSKYNKINDI